MQGGNRNNVKFSIKFEDGHAEAKIVYNPFYKRVQHFHKMKGHLDY